MIRVYNTLYSCVLDRTISRSTAISSRITEIMPTSTISIIFYCLDSCFKYCSSSGIILIEFRIYKAIRNQSTIRVMTEVIVTIIVFFINSEYFIQLNFLFLYQCASFQMLPVYRTFDALICIHGFYNP